jgi:AcrR family transcriptional regulator
MEATLSAHRASRILDAAAELLLRYGYRKVTIDDVAGAANVGKGTVYLHWSSKLELFATVLVRDLAAITVEQIAALRDDPGEVRLHRAMRGLFLLVMRHPLARGFYTGDIDLLGALLSDTRIGMRFAGQKAAISPDYLNALYEHGLIADNPRTDPNLIYRFNATTTGFFLLERLLPTTGDATLETKADALATTVRRGFETATKPTHEALAAATADVITLYEHLLTDLTRALPDEDRP